MTTTDPNTNRSSQLDNFRNLITSSKLSEVSQGIDQIKEWLKKNLNDFEVYGILLDAVQIKPDFRSQVRDLLNEMKKEGSKYAETALSRLPTTTLDLITDADDAYYSGEYKQASELYRKVLLVDPDNIRAKEQLEKATLEAVELDPNIPRQARQFFRKARSYIAAGDYTTAIKMLSAAVEYAEEAGGKFSDAQQLLDSIQDLSISQYFRERAHSELERESWKDALDSYKRAITLDPTNEIIKKEHNCIQILSQADSDFRSRGILRIFIRIRPIQNAYQTARRLIASDNTLFKDIEKYLNQIILYRVIVLAIIVCGIIFYIYYGTSVIREPSLASRSTITPEYTFPPPVLNTSQTGVPSAILTATVIPTFTKTPAVIFTEPILSPTAVPLPLGIGYINRVPASARNNPNGTRTGNLEQYQIIIILEQKRVGGSTWYRCTWNRDDEVTEGWILGDYISLGPPPTTNP